MKLYTSLNARSNNKIINLPDPVDLQDGVTKSYVDSQVSSVSTGGGINSPLITEGDIWYRNANGDTRLGKGVKGQVLTQAYGNSSGLEWRYSAGYAYDSKSVNFSPQVGDGGKFIEVDTSTGSITVNIESIETYVPYYFFNKGNNQVIFYGPEPFQGGVDRISIPYGIAKVIRRLYTQGYIVEASFNADYNNLTNKPTLSNVATSGNYNDLTNKPVGFYQGFTTTKTASYTIVQADHGLWIPCNTNNLTITFPSNLLNGTQVIIDRQGTATVSFAVTGGATLLAKSTAITAQYGVVHAVFNSTGNYWRLTGSL